MYKMEMFAPEIGFKMLHAPNCGLHYEVKQSVISFVFLEFPTGVRDDVVRTGCINLRENGAETSGVKIITEGSIGNESVTRVASRIADNGFRAQNGLKLKEGGHGRARKHIVDPGCVFAGESGQRRQNLGKISDMSSEEIT